MSYTSSIELLDHLISRSSVIQNEIETVYMPLPADVRAQQPAPGKWSMDEIMAHMDISTRIYLRQIKDKFAQNELPDPDPDYTGNWKGRLFEKMMQPRESGKIPMPMSTMKIMEPSGYRHPVPEAGEKLHATLNEWIMIMEKSKSVSIKKIRVKSALGGLVKLRLADAYRFLTAHLERHRLQLERTLKAVSQED